MENVIMRWPKSHLLLGILLAAQVALIGCDRTATPDASEAKKLRIVVSIPPQAYLVERIGGDRVEVATLVGPGESPHTYQPTDAQVSNAMRSDIFFRIRTPFERGRWAQTFMSSPSVQTVDLSDGLQLRTIEAHHHDGVPCHHAHDTDGETALDPHVWLSPGRLMEMSRTIRDTLSERDPTGASDYLFRCAELISELEAVDAYVKERLAAHEGRAFFVFHPAWGYFADDYGLHQIAIEVGGKQPTDAELTEFIRIAREENVSVVFVQPQITGDSAEAVAEAIGGRTAMLDPIAFDVLSNIKHAADAIAEALQASQ
jgi:zinc transport system substrate-binding protein